MTDTFLTQNYARTTAQSNHLWKLMKENKEFVQAPYNLKFMLNLIQTYMIDMVAFMDDADDKGKLNIIGNFGRELYDFYKILKTPKELNNATEQNPSQE